MIREGSDPGQSENPAAAAGSGRCVAEVVVRSPRGLHARPATVIAERAGGFACRVTLRHEQREIDAKSVLHLMMLAATQGTVLQLETEGVDAAEAAATLIAYFEEGFGELDD